MLIKKPVKPVSYYSNYETRTIAKEIFSDYVPVESFREFLPNELKYFASLVVLGEVEEESLNYKILKSYLASVKWNEIAQNLATKFNLK
jgi:hypothetical protein